MFFRPKSYAMKVDPKLKYAWINIPKCASSFVQKALDDNGWNNVPEDCIQALSESESIKKLVVLRDPVDRWISGFAQCMTDRPHSEMLELLKQDAFWHTLALNPVLDDHTEYQYRFIGKAKNLEYIYLQPSKPNKFYREFAQWVRNTGGTADFDHWKDPINPAKNNSAKLDIIENISVQFKKNTLMDLHKKDYQLLERYDRFTN